MGTQATILAQFLRALTEQLAALAEDLENAPPTAPPDSFTLTVVYQGQPVTYRAEVVSYDDA